MRGSPDPAAVPSTTFPLGMNPWMRTNPMYRKSLIPKCAIRSIRNLRQKMKRGVNSDVVAVADVGAEVAAIVMMPHHRPAVRTPIIVEALDRIVILSIVLPHPPGMNSTM